MTDLSKEQAKEFAIKAQKEKWADKASNLQVLLIDEVLEKYSSFYRAEKELGISRVMLKRWYDCECEMQLSSYLYLKNKVEKAS